MVNAVDFITENSNSEVGFSLVQMRTREVAEKYFVNSATPFLYSHSSRRPSAVMNRSSGVVAVVEEKKDCV